jgi:hypothetical protein
MRMMEIVSLTNTYCKYFCKCHNLPPVKPQYNNNKLRIKIMDRKRHKEKHQNYHTIEKNFQGQGCSSVFKHLPSKYKALDLIPST